MILTVSLLIAMSIEQLCTTDKGVVRSNGFVYSVLMETTNAQLVKSNFNWKTRCGAPVSSVYLPQRPGTKLGESQFEMIPITPSGNFKLNDVVYIPTPPTSISFYVYAVNPAQMKLFITTKTSVSVKCNQERQQINMGEETYCKYITRDICKRIMSLRGQKSHVLVFSVLNAWSIVKIAGIQYNNYYKFNLLDVSNLYYTPFIPYNTALPITCQYNKQFVEKNVDRIVQVTIDANYTYGQSSIIQRLYACLSTIVSAPNSSYAIRFQDYTYQRIILTPPSNRTLRLVLIHAIVNRNVSKQCLEYTCVYIKVEPIVATPAQNTVQLNATSLNRNVTLVGNSTKPGNFNASTNAIIQEYIHGLNYSLPDCKLFNYSSIDTAYLAVRVNLIEHQSMHNLFKDCISKVFSLKLDNLMYIEKTIRILCY